jgi:hypothetical protein
MVIHIFWSGPFSLKQVKELKDEAKDYGIYQVYGHHPLYGSHVLLYIGKANKQTFGVRISQEGWDFEYDPDNIELYVGRLAGKRKITDELWEEMIDIAEPLLIHAHNPIYNNKNVYTIPEEKIANIHIHNWNSFRDLFPDVSGMRYTSKFDNITEEDIYDFDKGNVTPSNP